jgi:hypothetical protein
MSPSRVPSFHLSQHHAPPRITRDELEGKLLHVHGILERRGFSGILLTSEGAMRWLTGTRHQIVDIAPDAESPVRAVVRIQAAATEVTFITTRIEMPRVRDQMPEVFRGLSGVSIAFELELPQSADGLLLPGHAAYHDALGEIVRPLAGGGEGNQLQKLKWLFSMTTAVVTETALGIRPGMDGADVRGLVFRNLAARDVESNLILVALAGQERHFHPLYESRYRAEAGCWMKIVVGGRYADLIVSTTVMAKIGSAPSREEALVYAALQQGTVEYADLYRNGMGESEIWAGVGERFAEIEKKTGLKGFQQSAHFHHMGGPTSPLGNRDYLLEQKGTGRMFPWMQFAINPCDVLQYTKVELQGIVMPEGPPLMLDGSRFVPKDLGLFSEVRAERGTVASVANIVETE